jgi:hypothetical protein
VLVGVARLAYYIVVGITGIVTKSCSGVAPRVAAEVA